MTSDREHIKLLSDMSDGDVYYIKIGSYNGTVIKTSTDADEDEWLLYESVERDTHRIFYGTYQRTELSHLVSDAGGYVR